MELEELEAALEGVLFAAGEPVGVERLCLGLETDRPTLDAAAQRLMDRYRYERRGIRLLRLDASYQLCSAPEQADCIRRTLEGRKPARLSQPALEVLAIIAYYQPVTRAYVDQVRGVDSAYTVGLLLERELIEESGRLAVPGRPILYRTTRNFLRSFGLSSLEELPELPAASREGEQMALELEARVARLKAEKAAASSRTTAESVIVPGTAAPVDVSQLKGSNKHTDSGIIVEGLGNCLVKFAKCCTPVPGDPVIGFITRGYGVSVHRADCPNAAPENRKPEEAARWVRVSWVDSKLPNYRTALEVASKDRDNLTLDVAMALSAAKVKVTALSARSMPDGHAILRIEVEVRDKEELASVINKLNNIQGVYHVARMTGK